MWSLTFNASSCAGRASKSGLFLGGCLQIIGDSLSVPITVRATGGGERAGFTTKDTKGTMSDLSSFLRVLVIFVTNPIE